MLASALGLGAGWLGLAGSWREPAHEASSSPGVLWPNPRPIGAFLLQDHRGHAFTRERLDGVWTFMFFGYTHCPDICPGTLATLRRVERDLPANAPVPRQHVLVSVDPARDTVEHLARYVAAFGPEFLGVTGDDGELARLARDVGAAYFRDEPDDDGSYFVDHTASIMLVDPSWPAGRACSPCRTTPPPSRPGSWSWSKPCGRRDRRRPDQSSARARSPSTSSSTMSCPCTRIRPSFISRAATRENVSG